ncbi:c-type cytochrome [Campylobacter sp. RM16192]|uniref:c-type cytochrome n=1 Tax=Campylobacter sp. RM16192 TaxID=1660080 RepID=UPI0014516E48|nr:cytochrome c [Campylobacter sp. RM16192]QCD52174.1 cytochrome c [Campylobacter sp. RM16192]
MRFYKLSFMTSLLLLASLNANEPSYVFEAKGEFAKELKALVEKYSKEDNVTINVYEKAPENEDNGGFLNIGVNSKRSYSVERGRELYAKNCASCHGENGEKRAYGTSRKLTQISAEDIEAAFSSYLNDPDFGGKLKHMMKPVVSTTSYNDLGAIITFLKGKDSMKNSSNFEQNSDISTAPSQGSYLK